MAATTTAARHQRELGCHIVDREDDTSTHTSFDETMSKLSGNIKRLIIAIGTDEKSVKEIS